MMSKPLPSMPDPNMRIKLGNIFAVATLGLGLAGCGYDAIPAAEANAKAKWVVAQDAYKQRADVIPDLVSAVQGCAKPAAELVGVTKARAGAIRVDAWQLTDADEVRQFGDAQAQLTGALNALMAASQDCPDLKSSQDFLALQSQMDESAGRLATSVHAYNAAVRGYNLALQTLPTMLWAVTLFRGKTPMAALAEAADAQSARK
jgi:LemA protein